MFREKKSLFRRLTGILSPEEAPEAEYAGEEPTALEESEKKGEWTEEEAAEGQLTVDVYQLPSEIVIQTMVAGLKPDDLDVTITREMVTIKGKRERTKHVAQDNYFYQELYWGSFSRTVLLPEEIDVEGAEATEHHGLLTIRLPKIDKKKSQRLRVRTDK